MTFKIFKFKRRKKIRKIPLREYVESGDIEKTIEYFKRKASELRQTEEELRKEKDRLEIESRKLKALDFTLREGERTLRAQHKLLGIMETAVKQRSKLLEIGLDIIDVDAKEIAEEKERLTKLEKALVELGKTMKAPSEESATKTQVIVEKTLKLKGEELRAVTAQVELEKKAKIITQKEKVGLEEELRNLKNLLRKKDRKLDTLQKLADSRKKELEVKSLEIKELRKKLQVKDKELERKLKKEEKRPKAEQELVKLEELQLKEEELLKKEEFLKLKAKELDRKEEFLQESEESLRKSALLLAAEEKLKLQEELAKTESDLKAKELALLRWEKYLKAQEVALTLHAMRFSKKFWEIGRVIGEHIAGKNIPSLEELNLRVVDKWILAKYNRLIDSVALFMREAKFDAALKELEYFIWQEFTNHYLELTKYRTTEKDKELVFTIYTIGLGLTKMLTFFFPYLCEAVYELNFKARQGKDSIHAEDWPKALLEIDEQALAKGELVKNVVSKILSWRLARGIPLTQELDSIRIALPNPELLEESLEDITKTIKAKLVVTSRELEEKANLLEVAKDVKVAIGLEV